MEMLLKFAQSNIVNAHTSLSSLKWCFLGGDWISTAIPKALKQLNETATLVSVGGPTETTLWNIMYEVEAFDDSYRSIPYGRPIINTTYFILNELLEECPVGVIGEMYVSGVGVAKGYINDEKRTQEAFILYPKSKKRMYKTGDLGRVLPNGQIEFIGRSDTQIQISGYRIELSEIESLTLKQTGVNKALALHIKEASSPYIALVYSTQTPVNQDELKQTLKQALPNEMVPKKLLEIEQFPLTANGKVDRNVLEQRITDQKERKILLPKIQGNEIQKTLLQLWQTRLERDDIGLYENFFEAGGNSLLATELFIAMREKFPSINSVVLLYEYTTVYELSEYIEQQTSKTTEVKTNKRGLMRRKRLLAKNAIQEK
jgi:acyl-coenzyme A synthetase/AMP-(fatty) acid ligase